jgi:phenylacetate-coenzyme A ligase PaaK-like adenylate-forming protein
MSLYTKLAANVLFPLHELIKGHSTIDVLRSMEETQWLPPEQLAEYQLQRLRIFLTRIGRHVSYYRELFDSLDFDPQAVRSLNDLHRLPLMGKPEIRENTRSMTADGAKGLQKFNTGGSTGEPLIFYLGKERVSHDVAAKRRATRWWGVDIGDPEIVVWGSPIELGSQDRIRLLRDKIFRTKLLSAFEMSEANLQRFVERIQKFRPLMLFGYPSSLALIANFATDNGYELDNLGIQVTFVTSERLYDHQRKAIEKAFGCPVANGYGGRDAGFIAHQCPSGAMHITAEDIVVEVVDQNGMPLPPGEKGEIVVTHLCTSDFPFVRYRTGDIGVLGREACACGRGLPILAEIEGRATDFVTAVDGTVMHGLALIYVLRELPEVEAFKIIQESLEKITLQLVTASHRKQDLEARISAQFKARLGGSLTVNFEYVTEIQRELSGKFRYVVSKLES